MTDTGGTGTWTRRGALSGLGTAGGVLLSGCQQLSQSKSSRPEIRFDHIGLFEPVATDLEAAFEESSSDVGVRPRATTGGQSEIYSHFVNKFIQEARDFDVGMMDVVWTAEFADRDWLHPVETDPATVDAMLSTPVETARADGTLYGLPMFTDTNALYYRRDLLESAGYEGPPETFSELVDMATAVVEDSDEDLHGYVWSGAPNEALTIEWHCWLWGFGGSVWDDDGNLRVDSPEGIRALQHAVDLVYEHEVTPKSVLHSSIDLTRQFFDRGNTVFMRNWSYAYALMQADSPISDAFGVTSMPSHEATPDTDNSCLGGWNAMLNGFSTRQSRATTFATWLGSLPAQRILADHGWLPVRRELYEDDWADSDKPAFLDVFGEIVDEARSRPRLPNYSRYSRILASECHTALRREKTPENALTDAQERIEDVITT